MTLADIRVNIFYRKKEDKYEKITELILLGFGFEVLLYIIA